MDLGLPQWSIMDEMAAATDVCGSPKHVPKVQAVDWVLTGAFLARYVVVPKLVAAALSIIVSMSSISESEGQIRSAVALAVCGCIGVVRAARSRYGVSALGHVFIFAPSVSQLCRYRTPDKRRLLGLDFDIREVSQGDHCFPPCDDIFLNNTELSAAARRASQQCVANVKAEFPTFLLIAAPSVSDSPEAVCTSDPQLLFCRVVDYFYEKATEFDAFAEHSPGRGISLWAYLGKGPLHQIQLVHPLVFKNPAMVLVAHIKLPYLPKLCIVCMVGSKKVTVTRSALLFSLTEVMKRRKAQSEEHYLGKSLLGSTVTTQTAARLSSVRCPVTESVKSTLLHPNVKVVTLFVAYRDKRVDGSEMKLRTGLRLILSAIGAPVITPLFSLYHCVRVAMTFRRVAQLRRNIRAHFITQPKPCHQAGYPSLEVRVKLFFNTGKEFRRAVDRHATLYLHNEEQNVSIAELRGSVRTWIRRGEVLFRAISVTEPGRFSLRVYLNLPPPLVPLMVGSHTFTVVRSLLDLKSIGGTQIRRDPERTPLNAKLLIELEPWPPSSLSATTVVAKLLSKHDESITLLVNAVVTFDYTPQVKAAVQQSQEDDDRARQIRTRRQSSVFGTKTKLGKPPSPRRRAGQWVFASFACMKQASSTSSIVPRNSTPSATWQTVDIHLTNGVGNATVLFTQSGMWTINAKLSDLAGSVPRLGSCIGLCKEVHVTRHSTEEENSTNVMEELLRLGIESDCARSAVVIEFLVSRSIMLIRKNVFFRGQLCARFSLQRLQLEEEETRAFYLINGSVVAFWAYQEYRTWTTLDMSPSIIFSDLPSEVVMDTPIVISCRLGWSVAGEQRYLTPLKTDCMMIQPVGSHPYNMKFNTESPFTYFDGSVTTARGRLSHAGVTQFKALFEFSNCVKKQLVQVECTTPPIRVSHKPDHLQVLVVGARDIILSSEKICVTLAVLDSNEETCTDFSIGGEAEARGYGLVQWQIMKDGTWCDTHLPAPHRGNDGNEEVRVEIRNGVGSVDFPRHLFTCSLEGVYRFTACIYLQACAIGEEIEYTRQEVYGTTHKFKLSTANSNAPAQPITKPRAISMAMSVRSTEKSAVRVQRDRMVVPEGCMILQWAADVTFPSEVSSDKWLNLPISLFLSAAAAEIELCTPHVCFGVWCGKHEVVKPQTAKLSRSYTASTTISVSPQCLSLYAKSRVCIEASLRQLDSTHLLLTSPFIQIT